MNGRAGRLYRLLALLETAFWSEEAMGVETCTSATAFITTAPAGSTVSVFFQYQQYHFHNPINTISAAGITVNVISTTSIIKKNENKNNYDYYYFYYYFYYYNYTATTTNNINDNNSKLTTTILINIIRAFNLNTIS